MEKVKDSIESFGFSYAGNIVYLKETAIPLISSLSDVFKQIGIKEVADKKKEDLKNSTYAINIGNDFFTQVIIVFKEHEILTSWLVGKVLDLTTNKIVEVFAKRKNTDEKLKEKIFISFIKSNKKTTVKLSTEGIDKENLNDVVHIIMKELSEESSNDSSYLKERNE